VLVEIDECMLVQRKYNVGHLVREQLVFGAREVESLDCVFPVENEHGKLHFNYFWKMLDQVQSLLLMVGRLMGICPTSVTLI
jgi:hypothetical protein